MKTSTAHTAVPSMLMLMQQSTRQPQSKYMNLNKLKLTLLARLINLHNVTNVYMFWLTRLALAPPWSLSCRHEHSPYARAPPAEFSAFGTAAEPHHDPPQLAAAAAEAATRDPQRQRHCCRHGTLRVR